MGTMLALAYLLSLSPAPPGCHHASRRLASSPLLRHLGAHGLPGHASSARQRHLSAPVHPGGDTQVSELALLHSDVPVPMDAFATEVLRPATITDVKFKEQP